MQTWPCCRRPRRISPVHPSFHISAFPMNVSTSPDAEFAYGSGHVNPIKAINLGLIYDADVIDYIKFLCGQGYGSVLLQLVTADNSTCTEAMNGTVWDLNLPLPLLSLAGFCNL